VHLCVIDAQLKDAIDCCTAEFHQVIMLSWINKYRQRKREPEVYASVTEGLKKLYRQVSCTTLILQLSFVIKYNSLQIQFVAISVCFSEFKILR